MPSETIAELPVKNAAINLEMAMSTFANIAAKTALVDPDDMINFIKSLCQ